MWDRKVEGGFPEVSSQLRRYKNRNKLNVWPSRPAVFTSSNEQLKVLKQRIRNVIQPKQSLGHSDKPGMAVIPSS